MKFVFWSSSYVSASGVWLDEWCDRNSASKQTFSFDSSYWIQSILLVGNYVNQVSVSHYFNYRRKHENMLKNLIFTMVVMLLSFKSSILSWNLWKVFFKNKIKSIMKNCLVIINKVTLIYYVRLFRYFISIGQLLINTYWSILLILQPINTRKEITLPRFSFYYSWIIFNNALFLLDILVYNHLQASRNPVEYNCLLPVHVTDDTFIYNWIIIVMSNFSFSSSFFLKCLNFFIRLSGTIVLCEIHCQAAVKRFKYYPIYKRKLCIHVGRFFIFCTVTHPCVTLS